STRNWYKRLPEYSKWNGEDLVVRFKARYCLSQYKLRLLHNQTHRDYFYRLNAAVRKAKILVTRSASICNSNYDRLTDRSLRMRQCKSVQLLERLLLDLECSQRKPGAGGWMKKPVEEGEQSGATNKEKPWNNPSVNKVSDKPSDGSGTPTCSNCGKGGHERDDCLKLMTCTHCGKAGHPVRLYIHYVRGVVKATQQMKSVKRIRLRSSNTAVRVGRSVDEKEKVKEERTMMK
ncbi:TPA: hypothetical protein N0F65_007782, partial [Lagenidium giganteum]